MVCSTFVVFSIYQRGLNNCCLRYSNKSQFDKTIYSLSCFNCWLYYKSVLLPLSWDHSTLNFQLKCYLSILRVSLLLSPLSFPNFRYTLTHADRYHLTMLWYALICLTFFFIIISSIRLQCIILLPTTKFLVIKRIKPVLILYYGGTKKKKIE